jgi:hypothetical protein
MKRITWLTTFGVITAIVCMIACKKGDMGPAGSTGPAGATGAAGAAGPIGPTGQSGNANVMQYEYAPTDANGNLTGLDLTLAAPDNQLPLFMYAPNDTLDKAAWFTYLFKDGAAYAVPGAGPADASTYSFWFGYYSTDTAVFVIDRVSGPGELFDGIKLVRILISNVSSTSTHGGSGRPGLPDIDFKNYAEVKKYYNLK